MTGNTRNIRHGICFTSAFAFFVIGLGESLNDKKSVWLNLIKNIALKFKKKINFHFSLRSWMLQFVPGHRENIVCRRDGTLRYSEPSAGDNLACIIPFILIYYFLIAANVWFAIFTYAWYLQTKHRGKNR